MRLANKITLANISLAFAVLAANAVVRTSRESDLFEVEAQRDHRLIAQSLASSFLTTYERSGAQEAEALIARGDANVSDVKIRWVWLDVPPGHLDGPSSRQPISETEGVPNSVLDPEPPGPSVLRTYLPLRVAERRGAIEISESMATQAAYIRTSIRNTLIFTSILAVLFGLAAIWMGRRLLGNPLKELTDLSRRIAQGELGARTGVDRPDEIGDLARQMNVMGASIANAQKRLQEETDQKVSAIEQLRHAERLTTVGKLASGVAHELGTPLNVVLGRAKMISTGEVEHREARDSANIIVDQAKAMTAIIRSLLDFARPRPPLRDTHEVASLIQHTLQLLRPLAEKRAVSLQLTKPEVPVRARVDAGQLQQVLTNLVMNAVHASGAETRVTVAVSSTLASPPDAPEDEPRECVRIDVIDEGVGIPARDLERIFEPFFTTKQLGEGTGLGLSVSYGLVREHGGWIAVESTVGRGSRFSVFLPTGGAE